MLHIYKVTLKNEQVTDGPNARLARRQANKLSEINNANMANARSKLECTAIKRNQTNANKGITGSKLYRMQYLLIHTAPTALQKPVREAGPLLH